MKHSAPSRDPLEVSNKDANLIRIEKDLPFFSFQMLLVLCHGCCTGPVGGRMNGDRRILVGIQPRGLECRFASCNV
jgi:hypothetical protein